MGGKSWLAFREFLTEHESKFIGVVYMGAAFLVVIIGFRGLNKNEVPELIVKLALGLEFVLIMILAFVTILKSDENNGNGGMIVPDDSAMKLKLLTNLCEKLVAKWANSKDDTKDFQIDLLKILTETHKPDDDTVENQE